MPVKSKDLPRNRSLLVVSGRPVAGEGFSPIPIPRPSRESLVLPKVVVSKNWPCNDMSSQGDASGRDQYDELALKSEEKRPKESCVKHFDALWFCYCEQPAHSHVFSITGVQHKSNV